MKIEHYNVYVCKGCILECKVLMDKAHALQTRPCMRENERLTPRWEMVKNE